ncbi:HAMP domain-containing sensor histidine kinase [Bradyrhizobium sp. G127]|uniref:sensor histidine kinase n=1 Tax=Bradyrhizobium sp. G127 TaxID=2904800 RepID=UPI001F2E8A8E|nr:HAMP domain-containing sensor histidine kinase [Bradyrhizobium sp. G127]MCF2521698.1 HAMP domain-containing histidine kinase [Bradyrhizobium sp. G127]
MVRSLRARLLLGAVLWTVAGVAIAGFSISTLFRTHVTELVNAELIGHLDELERLLIRTTDGHVALARRLSDPRFAQPRAGFYWQVSDRDGFVLQSPPLEPQQKLPPPAPGSDRQLVRSLEVGPFGDRMIAYGRPWENPESGYVIQVGADQRIVDDVLAHFNHALILSLGTLAVALIGAGTLQIWFGLSPMRRLRSALGDIRAGKAESLPNDFPSEVRPLVDDLNALIDGNTQMIRRARTQAGNLAHGLKTPLAILTDEARRLLARGDTEGAAVLTQQSERMQRQIDFQLARARAAANAGLPGVITPVEPALTAIAVAMRRLYAERSLTIVNVTEEGLVAAVDPNDLDEMVANLTDNACKWAHSRVSITAARCLPSGQLCITIVDDGPGIPPEALSRAFAPGERLDEATPGSGLGLAIVRDLAALHGGSIELTTNSNGGLHAELRLPAA